MKTHLLRWLLPLLLLLPLAGPAWSTTPSTAGPSLATALNPDGTLVPGTAGSFDAQQFRMSIAPDGRPVFRPAGTKGAGDERWADGFGLPNGPAIYPSALLVSGNDLYIGGSFTAIDNLPAHGIAKWNGTAWSTLGTGATNGVGGVARSVYALAVAGNGDVYVGGYFTQAGGISANNVAKWNGSTWSSLGTGTGNGLNGYVEALAVAPNGDLYASGNFTQAGGATATRIAKWNGTSWSNLGTGFVGSFGTRVNALAVAPNGDVYAGGNFTQAGGATANGIAKWNGTVWTGLGAGIAGSQPAVNALAIAGNGDVYAGGTFSQAGGVPANNVAKWNGSAWSSLGTATGPNGQVIALALNSNGDVYVGGAFTQADGAPANSIAKWNGTAWSSLGVGFASGVTQTRVFALALAGNGNVYAGGDFTQADGAPASNLAKWNGSVWGSIGTGSANGLNGDVRTLAVAANGDVYVAGSFGQAGGVLANNVAKWNGTAWSTLGSGLNGGVMALALGPNGDVYVGGRFTQAGGVAVNNVAKWDGTSWSSLGSGMGAANSGDVFALAVASNGDVYAGGRFTQAGGAAANYVAKWNGTTWSSLGTGVSNGVNLTTVYALTVASNGDVYVGGNFVQAGGAAANNIAKWNGTAWSTLGNGVNGAVLVIALAGNGDVYAGGAFSQANGGATSNVAKWNGNNWITLGAGSANGVNSSIYALAIASNGDVYVGGSFTQAGGLPATSLAKWNGTTWSTLGTGLLAGGLYTYAYALVFGPTGKLYVGGNFITTGDGSKVMSRFAIYDPNAPLATTASLKAAPAALFPNPAYSTATLRLPAGAPRLPLTLTDALGRTVRRYPAPASAEVELELRGLPAGVYVVRCGEVSQRLVVE